jgi:uncharacterized protein (TIGR02145 family)
MKKLFFPLLTVLAIFVSSFKEKLNDVDSEHESVSIGKQEWTTVNSTESKFRNGDDIPQAKTTSEWAAAATDKKAAWCYYKFDSKYESRFGKLYNWYAVNDSRNMAPKGWHIPSNTEWKKLIEHLGENNIAKKMKSKSGWYNEGNGSDKSGFNGKAGGYISLDGTSGLLGVTGYWWSSSETDNYMKDLSAIGYNLHYYFIGLNRDVDGYRKGMGISVRFIKD